MKEYVKQLISEVLRTSWLQPFVSKTERRKGGDTVNELKAFFSEEDAVSTVEIILILIVLIALVVLFKDQLTGLVNSVLGKAVNQGNKI